MRVLVINGSPRGAGSNTMRVTNAFVKGICEAEESRVKTFDLINNKISQCIGCYTCWKKTPGVCIFSDDAGMIFDYMLAADVVIWSFPLYFFGLPAKMKALIERQLPLNSPFMSGCEDVLTGGGHKYRYDVTGKKFVLISTCGFYFAPSTYDGVTGHFDMIYGQGGYEKIFVGEGELFNKPYLKKKLDSYLETVAAAGSEFARGGITEETRSSVSKILYPHKFYAEIADKSWGVKPEDFHSADEATQKRVEKIKKNFI